MSKIKYPIGIQTFENIRKDGYIYVDKTEYVYQLVDTGKYYFLSRPRRFGKSLLLSTIEAFFKGRRDLFSGLAIDKLEWDWKEYPVVHIDFNGKEYREDAHLEQVLNENLSIYEKKYGYTNDGREADERLRTLIRTIFEQTGLPVVVLVDEYDQPLLRSLHDKDLSERFRSKLQAFYSGIKTMDSYIRFGMLTGVSRFSKVSIFSGLNNLQDLSIDPDFNSICGISESELSDYFGLSMKEMSEKLGISLEQLHDKLKYNYDGYHFAAYGEDIYNPFSLLNTFKTNKFGSYWFATGTASSLFDVLNLSSVPISDLEGYRCSETFLTGADIFLTDPVPYFFQTGYLTIKKYDSEYSEYTLGFPNKEVSQGFNDLVMKSYLRKSEPSTLINDFVRDVRSGKAEDFMKKLQSFTAGIPYDLIKKQKEDIDHESGIIGGHEVHYHNMMYVIMKLMGFYTQTEMKTSDGRIDMVIETQDYVYVMEFKIDKKPEEALKQINEKEYTLAFSTLGKKLFKIGASFSTKTRRLSGWIIGED